MHMKYSQVVQSTVEEVESTHLKELRLNMLHRKTMVVDQIYFHVIDSRASGFIC